MFLINILLVDDHALFSKSLEIALSDYSEIETFDSINDVSQLDNYIVSKKPDIILMDINLKNISSEDGLELAKQILSCYPEQRVVILSGYDLPVYRSEGRCPEWGKVLGRRMNFGISVNSRFPPNGKDIGSYCILGLLTGKRMFG